MYFCQLESLKFMRNCTNKKPSTHATSVAISRDLAIRGLKFQ